MKSHRTEQTIAISYHGYPLRAEDIERLIRREFGTHTRPEVTILEGPFR